MQVRNVLNFRLFSGAIVKLIRGRRMESVTERSQLHNHFTDLLILKVVLTYIATEATYCGSSYDKFLSLSTSYNRMKFLNN